jgi:hypothetical protein
VAARRCDNRGRWSGHQASRVGFALAASSASSTGAADRGAPGQHLHDPVGLVPAADLVGAPRDRLRVSHRPQPRGSGHDALFSVLGSGQPVSAAALRASVHDPLNQRRVCRGGSEPTRAAGVDGDGRDHDRAAPADRVSPLPAPAIQAGELARAVARLTSSSASRRASRLRRIGGQRKIEHARVLPLRPAPLSDRFRA